MLSQVLLCTAIFTGAFEFNDAGRAPLFPSGTGMLELENPSGFYDPAAGILRRGGFISASGSNPYGIDGLTSTGLAAGYSDGKKSITAGWSRFGVDEYMENTAGIGGGYRQNRFFSAGIMLNWYSQKIQTPELNFSADIFDWDISLYLKPFDSLHFLLRQKNITSLLDSRRGDLTFAETILITRYDPVQGFGILWSAERSYFGIDHSISVSINILKNFSVRGGYYPEIETAAAGFSFIYENYSADYTVRFHPYLGGTHVFAFTAATDKISVSPLKYHNRFFREADDDSIVKIDINICGEEKIRGIPVLEKEHADRIIRYRKIFGRLTTKSLRQIGMSTSDIRSLNKYIVELPKEEKPVYGAKKKKISPAEERKRLMKILFVKLCAEGLSPVTAMNFTEASFSTDKSLLDELFAKEKEMSAEKKKKVRTLCRPQR